MQQKIWMGSMVAVIVILLAVWSVFGGESTSSSSGEELKEILRTLRSIDTRLQALEEKIDVLWQIRPNFATLMPFFSERFHVLHFAGDAGDWATAGHELLQMEELAKEAKLLDPERGVLLESFMGPFFTEMKEVIASQDSKRFRPLLENTVKLCNGCHVAVGSDFIKVSLQPTLSLRHPHILSKTSMPAGHTHGHESLEESPEEHHEESGEEHHEEEKEEHKRMHQEKVPQAH